MNANVSLYLCSSCGTVFASNQGTGFRCIHCGKNKVTLCEHRSFEDYKMILFEKTYEEAIKEYKKSVLFNPLMSISLKTKKYSKDMQQVYIPCTLYNINVTGNIVFLGKDKNSIYEIGYETSSKYKLLKSTLTEIDDTVISTINDYSYNKSIPFDISLINNGFFIGSNIENDVLKQVEKHLISIIRKEVQHPLKKVKENNLNINIISAEKIMIPAYFLSLKEKSNINLFLMNGQTGKKYCYPAISIFSTIVFSLLIFIIIFSIIYFLGGLV